MKSIIAQILLFLLMTGVCVYHFSQEPVRSEFSDQMLFWGFVSLCSIFFAYDLHKSSKEYEKDVNEHIS